MKIMFFYFFHFTPFYSIRGEYAFPPPTPPKFKDVKVF